MRGLLALAWIAGAAAGGGRRQIARDFLAWRRGRFGGGGVRLDRFEGWDLWRTRGFLTDPASGAVLARVEGIEATRRAPARGGAGDYLVPPAGYRVARSYAYADADTGDELASYRARPGAPARAVARPAPYAATVTHGLLSDGSAVECGGAVRGGRALTPRTAAFLATGAELAVDCYVAPDGSAAPPRARNWLGIGFAKPASAGLERARSGLRCRETYVVARRGPLSPPRVAYRRLGEGPAWAGPGKLRACDLALDRTSKRRLLEDRSLPVGLAAAFLADLKKGDT